MLSSKLQAARKTSILCRLRFNYYDEAPLVLCQKLSLYGFFFFGVNKNNLQCFTLRRVMLWLRREMTTEGHLN